LEKTIKENEVGNDSERNEQGVFEGNDCERNEQGVFEGRETIIVSEENEVECSLEERLQPYLL
jgi:hypothetical protein